MANVFEMHPPCLHRTAELWHAMACFGVWQVPRGGDLPWTRPGRYGGRQGTGSSPAVAAPSGPATAWHVLRRQGPAQDMPRKGHGGHPQQEVHLPWLHQEVDLWCGRYQTAGLCHENATDGMSNVASKNCTHRGFTKVSKFGVAGTIQMEFCSGHVKEGMINLRNNIFTHHRGCTKVSSYGVAGTKKMEFCCGHTDEGMVCLTTSKNLSGARRGSVWRAAKVVWRCSRWGHHPPCWSQWTQERPSPFIDPKEGTGRQEQGGQQANPPGPLPRNVNNSDPV